MWVRDGALSRRGTLSSVHLSCPRGCMKEGTRWQETKWEVLAILQAGRRGLSEGAKESLEIGSRELATAWNRRWDIPDVQLWWLVDFAASHKTENTGGAVTLGEDNTLNFRISDLEVPWGCKHSSSQLSQSSGFWLWVNDLIPRTSTSSHLRKGDWQVVFKEKLICPRNSKSFHQHLLYIIYEKRNKCLFTELTNAPFWARVLLLLVNSSLGKSPPQRTGPWASDALVWCSFHSVSVSKWEILMWKSQNWRWSCGLEK